MDNFCAFNEFRWLAIEPASLATARLAVLFGPVPVGYLVGHFFERDLGETEYF